MPEAERLETLALLQQNRTEVEAQLAGLPLRIETHSMVSAAAASGLVGPASWGAGPLSGA
jgi:hypothetical protein